VEKLMGGPQAPAAGALEPEERPEKAGRKKAGGGGIEQKEDGTGRHADQDEDAGPPATPARTV